MACKKQIKATWICCLTFNRQEAFSVTWMLHLPVTQDLALFHIVNFCRKGRIAVIWVDYWGGLWKYTGIFIPMEFKHDESNALVLLIDSNREYLKCIYKVYNIWTM